jgi:hypothetical protein
MDSGHQSSVDPVTTIDGFCNDWIAAWNAHDLERILSHYRDDVRFTSPFAARAGAPDGVLHGLPALRSYFEQALATYPDLHFEAIAALTGIDSVALHYRSVEGREAIEVMHLDQRGRVHRVCAHYTSALVQAGHHRNPR